MNMSSLGKTLKSSDNNNRNTNKLKNMLKPTTKAK